MDRSTVRHSVSHIQAAALRILVAVVVSLLFGCGPRPEQWGVVLWAPKTAEYQNGQLLPIFESSGLRDSYIVRTSEDGEMFEVPQWRVRSFQKNSLASEFAESYEPYADVFGLAETNALYVWENTEPDAKSVYKLREKEIVKIISQATDTRVIGGYSDVWYEVLTDDGVHGFAFGANIGVYSAPELARILNTRETDEFLERFMHSNFRPAYYRDMMKERRIDLTRFTPDYGVFPDPDNSRIVIVREDHKAEIEYDRVVRVDEDSYAFEGSTLRMTVHTPNYVNLSYSQDAIQHTEDFVYIDADIDLLILAEQERRDRLYEDLYLRGNRLVSAAYGEIKLSEDGHFVWNGFNRLVPTIIPPDAPAWGLVRFPLFLSNSVSASQDGALVFSFGAGPTVPEAEGVPDTVDTADMIGAANEDGTPAAADVPFVYQFDEGGLRVTFIPEMLIEENLVTGISGSPVVIFFSHEQMEEPAEETADETAAATKAAG